jgi:hypothetical protein
MKSLVRNTGSLLALACALAGTAGCQSIAAEGRAEPAVASAPAPEPQERYLHAPELGPIIMRYVTDKGFMDPEFPPTVASPLPYLGDFYSFQAIKDVPADRIIADFASRGATLAARDENSVTLQFPGGYTGTFYPVSTLAVAGQQLPISHVDISGSDWREEQANVQKFRALVEKAGLVDSYFIPNPTYSLEQEVAKQMTSGSRADLVIDPDLARFGAAQDAVLFLPEGVHGKPDDANLLMDIIARHDIDWIGLEMLGPEEQPVLDAFVSAEAGSAAYRDARAGLLAYFAEAWNGRAGPKVPAEELYYFKLVEAAREQGVRVVGIEQTTIPFLIFRYGETSFGAAVRSLEWQRNLPDDGRGVVFGGSGHYNLSEPINVQDFVAAADPDRPLFSMKPLLRKTN